MRTVDRVRKKRKNLRRRETYVPAGLTSQDIIFEISQRSTTGCVPEELCVRAACVVSAASALSLLAFHEALGYTSLASSYRNLLARCRRTRFQSREDSILHSAQTRHIFFAASRAMVPRLLMRYLKPLMGRRACAFLRCATLRPSAVAGKSRETTGRGACVSA
jgi:hypothetical protein